MKQLFVGAICYDLIDLADQTLLVTRRVSVFISGTEEHFLACISQHYISKADLLSVAVINNAITGK